MKEANKTGSRADPDLVEPSEILDDSTRQVLDDYSRKFLGFIQQEKEKIRKQALQESERLIAEAEKKGRLAYEDSIKRANHESATIISHSRERAERVAAEAQRLSHALADLTDKAQRDIDTLRESLQRQADSFNESIQQNSKALADFKATMARESEASSSAIAHAIQSLRAAARESAQTGPKPVAAPEPQPAPKAAVDQPPPTHAPEAVADQPASAPAPKQPDDGAAKQDDRTFVGTLNINVEKGSAALFRRFKESLSKVPGLEISMFEDFRDRAHIVAFAGRPMPLLTILHQMSLVKSVAAEQGNIEVVLQEADRWVG